MKYITNIMHRLASSMRLHIHSFTSAKHLTQPKSTELHKPLGRWRIEQCNNQMNRKIDLSNEDHCGPCGQYALEQIKIQETPVTKI